MLESEIPTIECTNVTDIRQNTYSRIRGSRVRGLLFFHAVIHRTLASVPQTPTWSPPEPAGGHT